MSFYRTQLEDYLSKLEVKANNVLDIGGASNPVKNRVASWDVAQYEIADNGLEDGEYNIQVDLNNPKSPNYYFYDMIFCLEVYEYIINPIKATEYIYKSLNNEGKAIITFPFIYPLHNPKEHDYLRYTKRGVEKLLEKAGFKDWDIFPRRPRTDTLQRYYTEDGMRAAKGEDHAVTGFIVEAYK